MLKSLKTMSLLVIAVIFIMLTVACGSDPGQKQT